MSTQQNCSQNKTLQHTKITIKELVGETFSMSAYAYILKISLKGISGECTINCLNFSFNTWRKPFSTIQKCFHRVHGEILRRKIFNTRWQQSWIYRKAKKKGEKKNLKKIWMHFIWSTPQVFWQLCIAEDLALRFSWSNTLWALRKTGIKEK